MICVVYCYFPSVLLTKSNLPPSSKIWPSSWEMRLSSCKTRVSSCKNFKTCNYGCLNFSRILIAYCKAYSAATMQENSAQSDKASLVSTSLQTLFLKEMEMRDVTFKFSSLCCLRMLSVNMLQIFVVLNRKPIVHRFQCLDLYAEIASFADRLWWLSCGLQFLKLWTKLLFLITDWVALVHLTFLSLAPLYM